MCSLRIVLADCQKPGSTVAPTSLHANLKIKNNTFMLHVGYIGNTKTTRSYHLLIKQSYLTGKWDNKRMHMNFCCVFSRN